MSEAGRLYGAAYLAANGLAVGFISHNALLGLVIAVAPALLALAFWWPWRGSGGKR